MSELKFTLKATGSSDIQKYTYTNAEIYANRKIVAEYLQSPSRRKTTGRLRDHFDGRKRCCLGHICVAAGLKPRGSEYWGSEIALPQALVDALGMFSCNGAAGAHGNLLSIDIRKSGRAISVYTSLESVNDKTEATPQDIGKYLADNLMGGLGTPWKRLTTA